MISTIHLQNFKCFLDETLSLRPLTLVTGANAGGKSSLLQSILLAKQAVESPSDYVRLNGPFDLALGKSDDVLHQSDEVQRDITIETVTSDGATHLWKFAARENELILRITCRPGTDAIDVVHYLGAERMGPRDILGSDSVPIETLDVGARGEFTAQVLESLTVAPGERGRVPPALRHPSTEKEGNVITIGKQVELWMRDIVPRIEVKAATLPETNVSALRLRRGTATDWLRPTNIGFGISYSLPIVVAGLLCRPRTLLLVENPEAHLHPAGQSRMGRFLATVAASGAQVIVETHSDHVLNGVLLAAVDGISIHHDQIIIQHFHGDEQARQRAQAIEVNRDGGLSTWPRGFFDQSEKDMAAILEARRRG
jgi:predicted ATPase